MYIRTRVHTYTPTYTRGCEYKTPSLPANGFPPPKHWQPNQHLANLLNALTCPKVNT